MHRSTIRRTTRLTPGLLLVLLLAGVGGAQDPLTGPPNGPRRPDPSWHALVGATVHPDPGTALVGLTVVIRDGRIVSVSEEDPPAGARVWNLAGRHVYPGFIEPYVEVDAPLPAAGDRDAHWNPLVTPKRSALSGAGIPADAAKELRELGFAAAAIAPRGGVFRGTSALVSLGEPDPEPGGYRPPVHLRRVHQVVAFETTGGEDGGYPDSHMGTIALIRQTWMDADTWAGRATGLPDPRTPGALAALRDDIGPVLFVVEDELQGLRAAKILDEAVREGALLGCGTEFRRLEAIRATGLPVILPLAFSKKPDVKSLGAAESVSLRQLATWEQAPTNPRRLSDAGIEVALTTNRLEKRKDFRSRLQQAIRHGLSEERALAMLTENPARILGAAGMGRIEPGSVANLQITDGPVFGEDTRLLTLFVEGRPHEIGSAALAGRWRLDLTPEGPHRLELSFAADDDLEIRAGGEAAEADVSVEGDRVGFTFDHEPFGAPGVFVFSGVRAGETIAGTGRDPSGRPILFVARRVSPDPGREGHEHEEEEEAPEVPDLFGLPFGAYAAKTYPEPADVLVIEGGTIWTCGPAGVVLDGVVIAHRDRIVYVGAPGPEAAAALARLPREGTRRVVRARGKHVTPGLIDCHSHMGISRGVNESGQAVTAEVRIEDVLDPDDVGFYRALAGGLTAAHLLHGSANPIGGQNAVVKLRWGVTHPDDLLLEGAPPGIKFALGENVKQSNWGDRFRTRYPQTRMGVETLIRDRFHAAREYAAAWRAFEWGDSAVAAPRRDLELEALAEVLAGERLVHCHSYRQDEILMLCRVAEDFSFRIGTFQHVLEGYKVAEAIRERSLGGSCFSDWWAYKVEVQDAIPENAAIMHEAGAIVSVNSDSADLARRLNTEAAKAVKYGGVSPEEALRFVTRNPAIQLGIDRRVGSLEAGKDADLVVWSGPPLSSLSRCERTFVDGREMFSLAADEEHRERILAERARLIAKVLSTKDEGDARWREKEREDYRCCDVEGGAR